MSYREQQREYKLVKTYLQLQQRDNFINELIYGIECKCYDTKLLSPYIATLYLHETNPEILIAINGQGEIATFDIKKIQLKNEIRENGGSGVGKVRSLNPKAPAWLLVEDLGSQICILFDSLKERQKFQDSLHLIIQKMCLMPTETDTQILKSFIKADKNRNRTMDYRQLIAMLQQLKICNPHDKRRICKFIGIDETNPASFIEYKDFERLSMYLACRKEFIHDFETFTGYKFKDVKGFFEKVMKKEDFISFLKQVQQQTTQQAKAIAGKIFSSANLKISFCDFCYFMVSQTNNILNDEFRNHEYDTSLPLNSYFCYSSHNTYLTGNQLYGESRASRYYDDLCDGVRCVEIDTNDDAAGPMVYHGGTMTSKITFEEVLGQIKQFCLEKEKRDEKFTPIIISIQNGCNLENQKKMAQSLIAYLGKRIFLIKDYIQKEGHVTKFPSLKSLMGKIIIKCNGNWSLYQNYIMNNSKNLGSAVQIVIQKQQETAQQLAAKKRKQSLAQQPKQKQVTLKINIQLLGLTSMLGKGTFGQPCIWQSVSLNQDKIENCFKYTYLQAATHTRKGWIRSYPAGSRINSSNYDPSHAFQLGVQIIALNTQSGGYETNLLRGFFQKGQSKTAGYRPSNQLQYLSQTKKSKKISIRPVSAMKVYYDDVQLRKQTPRCQIKMKLFCYSGDASKNSKSIQWKPYTDQVFQNCFNPTFNKAQTMKIEYTFDWLAYVLVEIDGAGIGVIPIENLRKGFRFVELYDRGMRKKESRVFFMIQ